jgi:hypothetical protein
MSVNIIGSGSIENLKSGETLLVQARKVVNDKIQLEWAEKIPSVGGRKKQRAVQLLNSSDPAFSSGAQRNWFSTVRSDVEKYLGIDLADTNEAWYISTSKAGEEVELMDLNILNPSTINTDTPHYFKMEIYETTEPNEWQATNSEVACKTAGKGGTPITHEGNLIFRNTDMVIVDPNDESTKVEHTFLKPDPRKIETQLTEEVIDFEEVNMVEEEN